MCNIFVKAASPNDCDTAAKLTFMAYHKYSYDIFGQVGEAGALDYYKKLWLHGRNRFSHHYSYIAQSDDNSQPVALMTCYPAPLISKLTNPTIYQLICIRKFSFFLHLITHLNNFYYFAKGTEIDPAEFYIATLSVLPEYRRQGIGAKMLRYARHLAREQGYKRCVLHVSAENESGIRFYEKNGFTKSPLTEKQTAYFKMVYSV